jgi:hypothetical protein
MIKAVEKLGIEKVSLNIVKPIVNIILSGKILKPFPLSQG